AERLQERRDGAGFPAEETVVQRLQRPGVPGRLHHPIELLAKRLDLPSQIADGVGHGAGALLKRWRARAPRPAWQAWPPWPTPRAWRTPGGRARRCRPATCGRAPPRRGAAPR